MTGSRKFFTHLLLMSFISTEVFAGVSSRVCRDVEDRNPVGCDQDFLVVPTPASGGPESRGVVTFATEVTEYDGGQILHVWSRDGEVHAKVPLATQAGATKFRTRSRKRLFSGFAVGHWEVAVQDSRGETLETVRFDVEGAEDGQLKVILAPKTPEKSTVPAAPVAMAPAAPVELVPAPALAALDPIPEAVPAKAEEKNLSLALSIGLSRVDYQQTLVNRVHQTNLDGRLAFRYGTRNGAYFGGNVARTLTTLSKNAADPSLRFLKGDLHVGSTLENQIGAWSIDLRAGAHATTMNPSGYVGYDDLAGPLFSPRLRRDFADGSALTFHFTYAPLVEGGTLTARNRELVSGLQYTQGRAQWTLDYGHLQLSNATTAVISQSVTALFGIGF